MGAEMSGARPGNSWASLTLTEGGVLRALLRPCLWGLPENATLEVQAAPAAGTWYLTQAGPSWALGRSRCTLPRAEMTPGQARAWLRVAAVAAHVDQVHVMLSPGAWLSLTRRDAGGRLGWTVVDVSVGELSLAAGHAAAVAGLRAAAARLEEDGCDCGDAYDPPCALCQVRAALAGLAFYDQKPESGLTTAGPGRAGAAVRL